VIATLFPTEHALNSLEAELLHQVEERQSSLTQKLSRGISIEEAFESWSTQVFGPLSSAIEEEGLDREFPLVGEDELFLLVNRHWQFLKKNGHASASPREAVFDYGARYAPGEDSRTDYRLKKLFLCFQSEEGHPPARRFLKETLLGSEPTPDPWDAEILSLVEEHGGFRGPLHRGASSLEQAFDSWYAAVYQPLCSAIDEEFLDLEFSGVSQVELFVLVCRHGQTMSRNGTVEALALEVVRNYKALFSDKASSDPASGSSPSAAVQN